jgi:hypothetical protein
MALDALPSGCARAPLCLGLMPTISTLAARPDGRDTSLAEPDEAPVLARPWARASKAAGPHNPECLG